MCGEAIGGWGEGGGRVIETREYDALPQSDKTQMSLLGTFVGIDGFYRIFNNISSPPDMHSISQILPGDYIFYRI